MDNHFDRRERTIYVWMLERSVTDDQLYTLFSKIGPIEKLIFKEYADGTPQHCLIVFRYVDSVLTAMSTLQGAEINGKGISLRPLRESTHAVLMPTSTMYSSSSPSTKVRTTTVTSSDGLSDHSDDHKCGGKKLLANWDAASSTGSASSGICNTEALELATEKLTIDDRRGAGGTAGPRSRASFSSVSSGGAASSPSNNSLSPPPVQQLQHGTIHCSLRKPWRPSRGPIPAPLIAPGGGMQPRSYGSGGRYGSHANLAPPPSLFSQIIPPSPGCGMISPSPYGSPHPHHHVFFGGAPAVPSPRPLIPEMYKPTASGARSMNRTPGPTGVFSPTAAPEEVVWRQQHHHHQAPPPPPLMSPPFTAGGRNWFDHGEYTVPQAYRGSATEQQLAGAIPAGVVDGGGHAPPLPLPPLSLGGMLPPNSPPIGQCTRYFDFSGASAAATLPRLRGGAPSSARAPLPSPWAGSASSARCAPSAPRSAAPFFEPGPQQQLFAWPAYRAYGARF